MEKLLMGEEKRKKYMEQEMNINKLNLMIIFW